MASKYRTKEEILQDKIEKIGEKRTKSELRIEYLKGLIKIERMNIKAFDTETELLKRNIEDAAPKMEDTEKEEETADKTHENLKRQTETDIIQPEEENVSENISEEEIKEITEEEIITAPGEIHKEKEEEISHKPPEKPAGKVKGFILSGEEYDAGNYITIWDKILPIFYKLNPTLLKNLAYDNWGTKMKAYLTVNKDLIPENRQGKIEGTPIIYHRNFTASDITENIAKLLERYAINPDEFKILTE